MSVELAAEWRNHRNRFGLTWLSSMQQKGRVVWVEDNASLRDAIFELIEDLVDEEVLSARGRDAIEKDILLIIAAQNSDRILASLDRTLKSLLKLIAHRSPEVHSLVWIDPDPDCRSGVDAKDVISWMQRGAKVGDRVCLGRED
ncbi:nucleotide exchange factor GrpE [Glycomyces sambucus]|nr:nucleotide exchange factor GrpE [Glycomyces sambucus]